MKKEQIKTAKFGGSSLADAAHFRKVKEIVEADPARRYMLSGSILGSRLPQFYGKDPEAISGHY